MSNNNDFETRWNSFFAASSPDECAAGVAIIDGAPFVLQAIEPNVVVLVGDRNTVDCLLPSYEKRLDSLTEKERAEAIATALDRVSAASRELRAGVKAQIVRGRKYKGAIVELLRSTDADRFGNCFWVVRVAPGVRETINCEYLKRL